MHKNPRNFRVFWLHHAKHPGSYSIFSWPMNKVQHLAACPMHNNLRSSAGQGLGIYASSSCCMHERKSFQHFQRHRAQKLWNHVKAQHLDEPKCAPKNPGTGCAWGSSDKNPFHLQLCRCSIPKTLELTGSSAVTFTNDLHFAALRVAIAYKPGYSAPWVPPLHRHLAFETPLCESFGIYSSVSCIRLSLATFSSICVFLPSSFFLLVFAFAVQPLWSGPTT